MIPPQYSEKSTFPISRSHGIRSAEMEALGGILAIWQNAPDGSIFALPISRSHAEGGNEMFFIF